MHYGVIRCRQLREVREVGGYAFEVFRCRDRGAQRSIKTKDIEPPTREITGNESTKTATYAGHQDAHQAHLISLACWRKEATSSLRLT